jgi:hypothetical protein
VPIDGALNEISGFCCTFGSCRKLYTSGIAMVQVGRALGIFFFAIP